MTLEGESVAGICIDVFGELFTIVGSLVLFQLCFVFTVVGGFVLCGFAVLGVFIMGLPWC